MKRDEVYVGLHVRLTHDGKTHAGVVRAFCHVGRDGRTLCSVDLKNERGERTGHVVTAFASALREDVYAMG